MAVSFALISQYQLHVLSKNFGIDSDVNGILGNSVELFSSVTDDIYDELCDYADNSPEKLEDFSVLSGINTTLSRKSSFLIIKKSGAIFYSGISDSSTDVTDLLPDYDKETLASSGEIFLKDSHILIKEVMFNFSDGAEGNAFIVTRTQDLLPQMKSTLMQMSLP